MALGVSQVDSRAARGCASKSIFVRFLYLFKASLILSWKLEDEAAVRSR
jgi:hypothetical protein